MLHHPGVSLNECLQFTCRRPYGRPFVSKLVMTTLCKKRVTSRDEMRTSRDNFDALRDEMHNSRDDFDTLRDEIHTSRDNLDTLRDELHASHDNCIDSREAMQDSCGHIVR